jgi:putative transcriptional regulator
MIDLKKVKSIFAAVFFAITFLAATAPASYSEAATTVKLEKGVLLVATEKVGGAFKRSVVLVVKYAPNKGTLGLIVNKPSSHPLSAFIELPEELENLHKDLFLGGPQNPKIPTLLLNTDIPPQGADELFEGVYFSGNAFKVLRDEAAGRIIHDEIRTYSGISSWARGQLEAEMKRGSWIMLKADAETVFSREPDKLWEDLQERLKGDSGHLIEVRNLNLTIKKD